MNKSIARILGPVVALLAIAGLFTNGHLLDIANVDIALDLLRIPIAIALLYAGYSAISERRAAGIVGLVGGSYVVIALLGLFSPTLFGLLPSGLTGFDIIFHALTGLMAVAAAVLAQKGTHHNTSHAH